MPCVSNWSYRNWEVPLQFDTSDSPSQTFFFFCPNAFFKAEVNTRPVAFGFHNNNRQDIRHAGSTNWSDS